MAKRLLILGGTVEAAALARAAIARFGDNVVVTTSLAGRTERPGLAPFPDKFGSVDLAEPPGLPPISRSMGSTA